MTCRSQLRVGMRFALDRAVPAICPPEHDECGKDNGGRADAFLPAPAPAVHHAGDQESGNQDAGGNIPEGHARMMAPAIVNFKVPHGR